MIIMLCVDNKNGMLFNRRRQSRDSILQQHVLALAGSGRLWMSPYSRKQFADTGPAEIIADDAYLEKAEKGDYCFVEDRDVAMYEDRIEKVILFKWNRNYPADTFFSLDLSGYTLEKTEDFAGNSHEKITKEIYRR